MKKHLFNKLINCLIFVFVASLLECISFAFMYKQFFPTYLILDILVFIVLSTPIFAIKTYKFDIIYLPTLMLILTLILIVNTNYYLVLGDVFSLQYLAYVGQGLSVINADFINFYHLLIMFSLLIIYTLVSVFLNVKVIKEVKLSIRYKTYASLLSVIMLVISCASYMISFNKVLDYERNEKDNYLIDLITLSKPQNFKDLGMVSYYAKEADYLYNDSGYVDSDLKDISAFLTNKVESNNEYTGFLKDYNVVTIMIETGTSYMINETLTPNLYSLVNEGINCENNYFKNKTNVSEYIGIVGNYPTSGLGSKKEEYVLPFSLPNMLSDYNTMYFHDVGSKKDIYSRKKLMPVLGFDFSYFHEDLLPNTPEWDWGGNYPLDSETMDSVLSYMLKDTSKPFYSFYTSLSMHGPYVNPRNKYLLRSKYYNKLHNAELVKKWENPLKGTVNESCFVNFMLACMDFDVAVGKMINEFKEKGIFDKTLFVLYGDHDLYYDGADGKQLSFSLENEDDINNYKLYDTVLTFYNSKLNEIYHKNNKYNSFKKFTTPHNIVPTILDLLGVNYNANLYALDSIFSSNHSKDEIFYSYELSCFFNDKYLTFNGKDIEKVFDENANSSDIFLFEVNEYVKKQSYIDKLYKSNFFKKYKYSDFCN